MKTNNFKSYLIDQNKKIVQILFLKMKHIIMVDRVGNAPTTSRMSSEHSTLS